ncbi:MAG: ADP-ribosylglycohydrolase family protein [Massiliimalia sp.]|jgi:ADP-ribosylglycohydrolase
MISFKKETLKDKIYACWIGKNIGGTMGTPYEGTREILDLSGFSTEPGVVLPNDDLDLQLVWLRAMDELGPEGVDEQSLAEYWITYIGPNWNEYGIGKNNLRDGLLPPLSGQCFNEQWLHSNGAWIRTEIWACLYPGSPENAIRYAFYDACVDHGYGEGTYAAIFIAAMESAAFVFDDIQVLLDIGLSKIPADCRVAKSVQLVRECYENGVYWKETRERLVEQSRDIGWFQAPANVGFVVLGLLYGQCDFKKSMILALNCGDDTDCTGATVGSLLGIMKGTAGIPADWRQYIGDSIVTICNLNGHGAWPKSNLELTDQVMNLHPVTLRNSCYRPAHQMIEIGEVQDISQVSPEDFMGDDLIQELFTRSPYSFRTKGLYCEVWAELDREPVIEPNGSISGHIYLKNIRMPEQKHYHLRWILPEGWLCSGRKNICVTSAEGRREAFTITAGEQVQPVQRIILEVTSAARPTAVYLPITLLG